MKNILDFENLGGFVIDLTTDELCDEILDDILCGDDKEFRKVIKYSLQGKRDYIMEYFTSTYDYVFCKSLNVYQVVEETLYTNTEFESLRKRVEQGFQYAMEKDNEIEELNYTISELKENIDDLEYSNKILIARLDDEQNRNNKLFKENKDLKDRLQKINVILEDKE